MIPPASKGIETSKARGLEKMNFAGFNAESDYQQWTQHRVRNDLFSFLFDSTASDQDEQSVNHSPTVQPKKECDQVRVLRHTKH